MEKQIQLEPSHDEIHETDFEKQVATGTEDTERSNASLHSTEAPIDRSQPSIICNYPYDLLVEVFHYHTRSLGGNPWTLAHVCQSWRSTALSYRMLWNRILVTTKKSEERPKKHGNDWDHCTNFEQLDRALTRAGESLLVLNINAPMKIDGENEEEISLFWKMMQLLGGSMTQRWQLLTLVDACYNCCTEWEDYFSLPGCSLDNLEGIYMNTPCPPLTNLVSRTSRKLTKADLPTAAIWLTRNEDLLWLRSLQILRIRKSHLLCFNKNMACMDNNDLIIEVMSSASYDYIAQVIAACVSLEFLIINDADLLLLPANGQYHLPKLTYMQVWSLNIEWIIISTQMPLTHLTLNMPYGDEVPLEIDLHFDKLLYLSLFGANVLCNAYRFVCPCLERLRIGESWSREEQIRKLGNHLRQFYEQDGGYLRLNPKQLTITDMSLPQTYLAWILHNMPSIECFTYHTEKLCVGFFHDLNSSDVFGTVLVPNLRVLTIQYKYYGPDRRSFEDLMQKIILFRKNNGCPLSRLSISYRDFAVDLFPATQ